MQKLECLSNMPLLYFLVFILLETSCSAQTFYVAAPNTIRLGAEETVAVAHDGSETKTVTLYIHPHPGTGRNITNFVFTVEPGVPRIVEIIVKSADLPNADFSNPMQKHFVHLGVQSDRFNKEVIIPVTAKSGYFFIHTDKPIYTPKQTVHIRLIPLNEKTLPTKHEFKLQIRNPQNIVQVQKIFNRGEIEKEAFVTDSYELPKDPLIGEWTILALHGPMFQLNSSVTFEVKKYVLPTFTLKLKVPDVILPDDQYISGSVEAKYVYGKNVKGVASFRLGVKGQKRFFSVKNPSKLVDGTATFQVNVAHMITMASIRWFPLISGKNLLVEATVTDFASGKQEVIRNENGIFNESPYVISFQRCLKDFKPGLVSVIEADIKYVNGNPAANVKAVVSAAADNNVQLNILTPEATSDKEGRVSFLIHPETHHTSLTATVRTEDPLYGANQAVGVHTQVTFLSKSKGYIAITKRSSSTLTPNELFQETVHLEPANITDVYFIIVSKGRILQMTKLPVGSYKQQTVEFQVTHEMAPSFRLVVFAQYRTELIADSLKLEVDDHCSPNAEVTLDPQTQSPKPGNVESIVIRGASGTLVGLLAVDEAVYSLRDKDRLTKSKMFRTLDSHDLGCGPGGGRSTNVVLGNAGVVIMTSKVSSTLDERENSCEERIRRKREVFSDIARNFTGRDLECCQLGMLKDKYGRSCENRTLEIENDEFDTQSNCSSAFLTCCLEFIDRKRTNGDFYHDIEIDEDFVTEMLGETNVRQEFRETWLFRKILIGPGSNREVFSASLPHSITTWVVQAISVSEEYGMCVADPARVVVFQDFFLQLNFPYSVVRQEQIEVRTIIFNYNNAQIPVWVYLYGLKDICSEATDGKRSKAQKVYVDAHSAASVSFPIVPLREGEFKIKVGAYSTSGTDIIMKTLRVVPEGYPVEKPISVKLDPTNQQRRKKRDVITGQYSDTIDPEKQKQVTSIALSLPEDFIPDSDSCVVSVIADEFGPPVETAVRNPDSLITKASDCGEQTMVRLAPTIYTMRYLKDSGKLSPEQRKTGLQLMQQGYEHELTFRKEDGSFSAFQSRPTSTWLTAFVMKVFCQASSLIDIERNVICSGVSWLVGHQNPDGSFTENHPVMAKDLLGGVQGQVPMTAFVLIALKECTCDVVRLEMPEARALSYLENNLEKVTDPLPVALVAYAMALSDSELKGVAYDKLSAIGVYDEPMNTLHWGTGQATQDVQITSYALLTTLLFKYVEKSRSIVNWLNTKRLSTGAYASTQDTVVALQALSEYAKYASAYHNETNLQCDITVSKDNKFHKRFVFNAENAMVAQFAKIPNTGGELFVNTEGYGVGLITASLKYHVPVPPEKQSKFEVSVNASEVRNRRPMFSSRTRNSEDVESSADRSRVGTIHDSSETEIETIHRTKRQNDEEEEEYKMKMDICVRYLGPRPSGMTIVDAGLFSGFQANREDLEELVRQNYHLVDKYEVTSRGVIFYLERVPTRQSYCFTFHITREFKVGNVQASTVNVYDYYNPEESCTKFYAPEENSPMLNVLCNEGVCQCAEGGCPPDAPFKSVADLETSDKTDLNIDQDMRSELILIACKDYNYAWKGKVVNRTQEAGYLYIRFKIITVIKEGIEKTSTLKNQERLLIGQAKCKNADLAINDEYYIMGKDGAEFKDETGAKRHQYILDATTALLRLWKIRDGGAKSKVEKALSYISITLPEEGCLD